MSVFIIAEAGVNHNGSIDLAKKLIDVASNAGADAVKFQSFKANNLTTKNAQKAMYQKETTNIEESQFDMLKKLELSIEMHKELISYCKNKKIIFLSSPFDHESIELLEDLGLEIFKIPSGEITNLPYLRHIGKLGRKIILSTGMSNIDEVKNALDILINSGTKKENITVLHANTEYPTPMEDVNLRAMVTIGKELDIKFGYSDHTLGIEVDIAAVAMGANCIEKHFTLDCNMEGPDHKASLEPNELKAMVAAIRNIELALGKNIKKPSKSELLNIQIVRKSIVAKTVIKKDEMFSEKNLTTKRPGGGTNPMKWDEIVGTKATKDYNEDELI
ncbi:MAG: N-acetylneuraminate synthase [Pelagibacteraceae bacterium]|jgi:N,N'-diacetyllegionaminate synthase|nr:N-acetylneuraminate synthase [Pelagibacteraceae bacterium]MBT6169346.1 N-acetylneuraminate synthase [Flavobacteriaceae bacterium]